MKRALLTALVFAALPAAAYAQTCSSPISMHDQVVGRKYSGDTTTGTEIGINLSGVILAHPSVVYSFTARGADGNITIEGQDRVAVVSTSCTGQPLAIGDAANPLSVTGLPDGEYLLIVSTSPGLPVTNPPTGGPFTVTIPVLPVSLQSFSVE